MQEIYKLKWKTQAKLNIENIWGSVDGWLSGWWRDEWVGGCVSRQSQVRANDGKNSEN